MGYSNPIQAQQVELPEEASQSWWESVTKDIESREYHFSQMDEQHYRCPNRANNLLAVVEPGNLTLSPHRDSTANWSLRLDLNGIYADGIRLYGTENIPVNKVVMEDARLVFDHTYVQEEYINTKEGVRQNFILKHGPTDATEIEVRLNVAGLIPNKVHDTEIHLCQRQQGKLETQIIYKDLNCWDAKNQKIDAHFEVLKNEIRLVLEPKGVVRYPITIDPVSTTSSTTLQSNIVSAQLGYSVSSAGDVNGDGYSDVVVGVAKYENGQSFEGAVFLYLGSATGLSSSRSQLLEQDRPSAYFGHSVACAGDVNGDGFSDIIVGVKYFTSGQSNEGAAFVYYGNGSGFGSSTKLEINQANAFFGQSVGGAGDVNGDGYSDVVVGAAEYENGQTDEGAAFVFHGSSSGISTSYATLLEENQASSEYGRSVAMAGDVNGDGYSDVVVGAEKYTNGESNEGHVFVYHGSSSGISSTATTVIQSNQSDGWLGYSVASAGDVNGDGYSDIIAGAENYTNGQTYEGAAFVYHGSASGVSASYSVILEVNETVAAFGTSVACAGDVNGDGYSDVVVGGPGYNSGGSDRGVARVYHGSASGINSTYASHLVKTQNDAEFGFSVACAGDVNGDGYSDIIVGAPLYNNGQSDEGLAFVYHGSPTGVSSTLKASMEGDQNDALFGYYVASAGDVNADGFGDVIVGARDYTNGQTTEGAAFVYHGSTGGLSTTAATQLESNQAGADFGFTASGAGDVNGDGYDDVIVGSPFYDNGESNEGTAFIYHGSSSGISSTASTTLEEDQASAQFGYSVSSAGDVNGDGYCDVVVGARYYDNGQSQEGAAFVYHGSSSGINSSYAARLEQNSANANFGRNVAYAGDVNGDGYSDVIVGADNYSNGQSNEGAIYIYHGSSTGISTTAATSIESNQASANLGRFSSSAGDVNGDGYSDVIAGVLNYDNGETNEGVVFVYHGSSTGISSTPATTLEEDQADALFGRCVSPAGDVNGDGYSDVIVGARYYENGQTDEGAAFIYLGSSSGLSTTADVMLEADQASANFGLAVAGAGDVNGDGYGDVIVGAYTYDNGHTDEGAVFVYHGGEADGLPNQLRFYDNLSSSRLTVGYLSNDSFAVGLNQKSFLGRQKGRLIFEVAGAGTAFSSGSNGDLGNSVSATDTGDLTDLTTSGTLLKKMTPQVSSAHKVRARIEYDKVTSTIGQVYGPWRYYSDGAMGVGATPLPVELIQFEAVKLKEEVLLSWITASEVNNDKFIIQRRTNTGNWIQLGEMPGHGTSSSEQHYSFLDEHPEKGINYYRLKQVDFNKDFEFSPIRMVEFHSDDRTKGFICYPNPADDQLQLAAVKPIQRVVILHPDGRVAMEVNQLNAKIVDLNLDVLPDGVYLIQAFYADGVEPWTDRLCVMHGIR
ncbi:MAG: FG-GAP repeat protein [Flavobacteriales bacterium]|nr:FG-GAP repeat protein [Bacteroidota bacterium]MCB9240738.1 FG-GAP repeat protein [Flavobacteriales bacterium]